MEFMLEKNRHRNSRNIQILTWRLFVLSLSVVVLIACGPLESAPPDEGAPNTKVSELSGVEKSSLKEDDEEKSDDEEKQSKSIRDSLVSSDTPQSDTYALQIEKAKWDEEDEKLKVEGVAVPSSNIHIYDSQHEALLAMTTVDEDGEWKIKVTGLENGPCTIIVESGDVSRSVFVEDAPDDCVTVVAGDDSEPSDPETDPVPTPDPTPTPDQTPGPSQISGNVQVIGFNDLGMHCMDDDYSVFSVLPPFNVLHAQVIQKGTAGQKPRLLSASDVTVRYSATADPSGSINSTSIGKTNFWDYVQGLFGASPEPDTGLLGAKMPSTQNGDQDFPVYDANQQWFAADGIPLTPIDDAGNYRPYPVFKVSAHDNASGAMLSSLDVTVPVSTEMRCDTCHNTGNIAANSQTGNKYSSTGINWSNTANSVVQYKENILLLHDAKHNTNLAGSTPVLCSDCHYSYALDLAGAGPQGAQIGKPMMSQAVHGRHGMDIDGNMPGNGSAAIISDTGKTACYNCHPGKQTQCFRGVMFTAGLNCQNCHGGLLALAGKFPLSDGSTRKPWQDMPACQSCHTGDAVDHMGNSLIGNTAYLPGDNSAQPIVASNKRFAEETGKLYRLSRGHGGVACEACHGSTHAIWPVSTGIGSNDNLTAEQLQGHAGFISECSVCHEPGSLPLTTNGPHGMHNVGDSRWNENHEDFYEQNPNACKACHGVDLKGTVLSRLSTDRTLQSDERQANGSKTINLVKGTEIGCDICHEMP